MYKRLNIRRQPPAPAVKSRRAEPIVQAPRPLLKRKNAFLIEKKNSCELVKSSEPVAKIQASIKSYFKPVVLGVRVKAIMMTLFKCSSLSLSWDLFDNLV